MENGTKSASTADFVNVGKPKKDTVEAALHFRETMAWKHDSQGVVNKWQKLWKTRKFVYRIWWILGPKVYLDRMAAMRVYINPHFYPPHSQEKLHFRVSIFPKGLIFHISGKTYEKENRTVYRDVNEKWKTVDKPVVVILPNIRRLHLSTNPQP